MQQGFEGGGLIGEGGGGRGGGNVKGGRGGGNVTGGIGGEGEEEGGGREEGRLGDVLQSSPLPPPLTQLLLPPCESTLIFATLDRVILKPAFISFVLCMILEILVIIVGLHELPSDVQSLICSDRVVVVTTSTILPSVLESTSGQLLV